MSEIKIETGKDLLDSKIKHFEVINGLWIGKVGIRNNHPWLYSYDEYGDLINSFEIRNNTILDLVIKEIYINDYKQKMGWCLDMVDKAYEQGRADAIEDMRKAILTDKELQFAPYSQDMWFKNRIMDIAERLTK